MRKEGKFQRKIIESLVDGVFDGAFSRDGEEDVVMGEGVVVASSLLEMLTKSCLCGMMFDECMSGSTFGGFSKTRGTSFVNELTKRVGEGVLAREVPSSFPSSSSSSLR
ncbi:hypothetical protein Tco_0508257 [Tanacetum coccineum]